MSETTTFLGHIPIIDINKDLHRFLASYGPQELKAAGSIPAGRTSKIKDAATCQAAPSFSNPISHSHRVCPGNR